MWALIAVLAGGGVLPWIHDNYPEAREKALAAGKPMVVDLWAPWCHTCLSMQQTVLADPALADVADQFVWLAMDTDRPANFAAVESLRPGAWPTFYVVDPAGPQVLARHVGSASPAEWRAFLAAGKAADGGSQALRTAERAAAAGRDEDALKAYAAAEAALPADHARLDSARLGRLSLSWKLKRYDECALLGLLGLRQIGATSALAADFTWYAHDCAAQGTDPKVATRLRHDALAPKSPLRRLLADPKGLTVDDHSDALRILREVQDADGQKDEARKTAESQLDLLLKAHAAADERGRMTFGYPLAEVAGYLGRGAEIVPLLEANTKALPAEYDPPYRLAGVLLKLGRLDEALAAAKQAEGRVYGGRKARALALIAQVHGAKKDAAAEKAAWQAVLDWMDKLPESQRNPGLAAQAKEALAR